MLRSITSFETVKNSLGVQTHSKWAFKVINFLCFIEPRMEGDVLRAVVLGQGCVSICSPVV